MVDAGEPDDEHRGVPEHRQAPPSHALRDVEPMSLEAAQAMQGSGWEGDLDAMRECRTWDADEA